MIGRAELGSPPSRYRHDCDTSMIDLAQGTRLDFSPYSPVCRGRRVGESRYDNENRNGRTPGREGRTTAFAHRRCTRRRRSHQASLEPPSGSRVASPNPEPRAASRSAPSGRPLVLTQARFELAGRGCPRARPDTFVHPGAERIARRHENRPLGHARPSPSGRQQKPAEPSPPGRRR